MIRWNENVTQGQHEPLISKELFMKVQELMHRQGTPWYNKHNPLFKNIFICTGCKGTMTWEIHRGHWYGHCNKHYRKCQKRGWLREEDIDQQVADKLEEISPQGSGSNRLLEWVQQALKEGHSDEINYRETATGELERKLNMATQRMDKLYDDKIDGKISQEFYDKKVKQYQLEQEEIQDSLNRHQNANLKYFEIGITILELARHAKEIYSDPCRTIEDKRTLIQFVFKDCEIDNRDVKLTYHPAFELIRNRLVSLPAKIKAKNERFEPQLLPINKGRTHAFSEVRPMWLPSHNTIITVLSDKAYTENLWQKLNLISMAGKTV